MNVSRETRIEQIRRLLLKAESPLREAAEMLYAQEEELATAYRAVHALEARLRGTLPEPRRISEDGEEVLDRP